MILTLLLRYSVTDASPEGKSKRERNLMSLRLPHLSLGGSTVVGGLTYLSTLQQLHTGRPHFSKLNQRQISKTMLGIWF